MPKNDGQKRTKKGGTKPDGASYRVRADGSDRGTLGYGDKVTSRLLVVQGKRVTFQSITTIRTRSGEIPLPDQATQRKLAEAPADFDGPPRILTEDLLDPVDGAITPGGRNEVDDRASQSVTLQHSERRGRSPSPGKGSRKEQEAKAHRGSKSRS